MVLLLVGVVEFFYGLTKSLALERIRKTIENRYRGSISELYRRYAITDTSHGMTQEEFANMLASYSNGQLCPGRHDVWVIMSSIDELSKGSINEQELTNWVCGGSMLWL